ncbi:MAG: hypothetical protein MJE77_16590 [Proteobacteria bacterium]|nr:hypothetical protein [Pseudomonadota bacterium]
MLISAGCIWRGAEIEYRKLTGNCQGACNYYLSCKESRGEQISERHHQLCEYECGDVFSSSESLLAFESLSCEDAIGFVEGDSGRGPGDPAPPAALSNSPPPRASSPPPGATPRSE